MANMSIAKMHRRARKFVGWIAAAGVFIAYWLSFFTVVTGVILNAWQTWPGQWVYLILSAIIGVLLSILVERLTLVQAAKVRNARDRREKIDERYDMIEDKTYEVERLHELELKRVKSGWAETLMVAGALISTAAGTLFWHYVLQHLPTWEAWGFSTLFSALVSFTLVESELHAKLQFSVISDAIVANNLIKEAGVEDARDQVIEEFARQHSAKLGTVMQSETMANAVDAASVQTLDEIYGGTGVISSYIDRERAYRDQQIAAEAERTRQQMQIIRGTAQEMPGDKLTANEQERNGGKATIRLASRYGEEVDTGEIVSPFHRGARR